MYKITRFLQLALINKIYYWTDMEDQHLQPPALTKQFLISPPSSPPVGWKPREENEPLVNHDLLAAIANLSAGIYIFFIYYCV